MKFINRAKDELVTPDDFDAFVAREQRIFEDRYGQLRRCGRSPPRQRQNLAPVRGVRSAYAGLRRSERAEAAGKEAEYDSNEPMKTADREARRAVAGTGRAVYRHEIPEERHPEIDALADSYVKDGAALEVMRLHEIASVYRAYQEKLIGRGALDFGEQIAAVTELFKRRPNVLRRWQRQCRYILVDEFQDANQDLYHAREPDELGVVMPESPPVFYLTENRRSTKAIHDFAVRFSSPVTDGPLPGLDRARGPTRRDLHICRWRRRCLPQGPRHRSAQLIDKGTRGRIERRGAHAAVTEDVMVNVGHDRAPVEAWPYRLMPEYGPEGSVLPPPTKGNEVRVATIQRYKGLESPVVVLAEIDGRVDEAELASLLYVGATRARAHLVVIRSEAVAPRLM